MCIAVEFSLLIRAELHFYSCQMSIEMSKSSHPGNVRQPDMPQVVKISHENALN